MKTKFIKRKTWWGDEDLLIVSNKGSKRSIKRDLKKTLGLAKITKEDINSMIKILKEGDFVEIVLSIVEIVNESGIYFRYHHAKRREKVASVRY